MKDPVEARRQMGYLSNNTKLSDKFTVREYLEMTGKRQTKDTNQYWPVPFSMETSKPYPNHRQLQYPSWLLSLCRL